MLIVGSMKSLFFSSIDMAILAYRVARANGLYCVLDGKSIKFETEEDAELFSDRALVNLLRQKGVDVTRPTKITASGAVYYTDIIP